MNESTNQSTDGWKVQMGEWMDIYGRMNALMDGMGEMDGWMDGRTDLDEVEARHSTISYRIPNFNVQIMVDDSLGS